MSRDTNFYYSFFVLPRPKREAIIAVWDFCRAVDDAVDDPNGAAADAGGEAAEGVARELEEWRAELDRCYGSATPLTWQGAALKPFVAEFGLPRESFEDVIDGVAMDLDRCRYETFEDLYEYCLRVASAVGLICLEIFGYENARSRDYAVQLGVALQLTNIVRDVRVDQARNRIYLPQEDLRRFGVSEPELRSGVMGEGLRDLLRFQCDRARTYYAAAGQALPPADVRSLAAATIMGRIYFEILRRIERAGYDVFSEVIRVPRPRRAWIALSIWIKSRWLGLA